LRIFSDGIAFGSIIIRRFSGIEFELAFQAGKAVERRFMPARRRKGFEFSVVLSDT